VGGASDATRPLAPAGVVAVAQGNTTWYAVVVDQADQPISPEVAVRFDPQETCRYILDWRRVN